MKTLNWRQISKENENNKIKKRYEGDIDNDKVLWGDCRVNF